jgi:hypothetical protein
MELRLPPEKRPAHEKNSVIVQKQVSITNLQRASSLSAAILI